jgi:hypothetical protein
MTVSSAGRQLADFDLAVLVHKLRAEAPNGGQIAQEKLVLVSENSELRLLIIHLNGMLKDNKPAPNFISGFLFYGR